MIYTVTFNPALDYVVKVNDFTLGKVNRTVQEEIYPGGKGLNVSMMLGNLGHKSIALGFLAGFTGDRIEELLRKRNVATDFIHLSNGLSRINVKMRMLPETEINGAGPDIPSDEVQKLYEKLDGLKEGDFLILAGSVPSSLPRDIYRLIMERISDSGVKTVVDAAGELLQSVLPMHPFLIKPNHHELAEIFQTNITGKEQACFYARRLRDMGAQNVLVSLGGDGAVLAAQNGRIYESSAPKGEVLNAVGAGDSMVAGFISGFLETESYDFALRKSICAGSATAFANGLASREEVFRLLSSQKAKI